jgi:hypothetical protein
MTLFRTVLLTSGLMLALSSAEAQVQPSAQDTSASRAASKPMVTLQMPALPAPVPVTLNSKTTALLVFDYVEPVCNSQPKCKDGMLPAMTPFHGAGTQGRPGGGIRHPRGERVQVAAGGRSKTG